MAITYPKVVLTLSDSSTLTWEDTDIIEASVVEEMHPISATLPISELTIKIYDPLEKFSIFDENEILAERQAIMLYENIDGTEYFLGKYYLDEWESVADKELQLSAVDFIGVLDTTPFDGRFYSELTSFETVLGVIIGGLEIDYEISTPLQSETVRGWIPPGTAREALQQLCFAAGAMVTTSRSEGLVFRESYVPYADKWHELDIEVNSKFMVQPVKKRAAVTGIELISHNFIQSDEQETIFEDTLSPGTYKIVFDRPYFNVQVTGAGYVPVFWATHLDEVMVTHDDEWIEVGGEFEFGPNWVILTVQSEGQVTITGNLWIDNQRAFTFQEAGVGSSTRKNELKIKEATLVSNENASRTLARVRDYYRQNYEHQFTLVPQEGPKYGQEVYDEAVYGWSTVNVKLGQMASIETVHGVKLRAVIEKADVNLAGGYLVKMNAIGVEMESE